MNKTKKHEAYEKSARKSERERENEKCERRVCGCVGCMHNLIMRTLTKKKKERNICLLHDTDCRNTLLL